MLLKKFDHHVKKVKKFVMESRKVQHQIIFQAMKTPPLENETRWTSTFLMIECFYKNKEVYKNIQNSAFDLPSEVWIFIDNYYNLFQHAKEAMDFFQRGNFVMSKFNFFLLILLTILKICL